MIRRNFFEDCAVFNIAGSIYQCPKWIAGIPLDEERERHLREDGSPMNQAWENFIAGLTKSYKRGELVQIREFPLPIANKTRFKEIARKVGGEELERELSKRHFFFLDYFMCNLGIAVELDSDWHKPRLLEDKVRDLYVGEEYGIRTLRVYRYGLISKKTDAVFNNKFKKIVSDIISEKKSLGKRLDAPLYIDFMKIINKQNALVDDFGLKYISSISERIYQELSFDFLNSEEIIVSSEWMESNYPGCDMKGSWIVTLGEFFYRQYFKRLVFM